MRISKGNEQGFTLTEMMIVMAIGLIITGMTLGGVQAMLKTSRADGGLAELAAAVRSARESAISNRRNVQITFGSDNSSVIATRLDLCSASCTTTNGPFKYDKIPGCTSTCVAGTTVLRTVSLEGSAKFGLLTTLPDTPDKFGKATSGISLGSKLPAMFTTDGSFIDSSGDVLSGTLFIANPTDPNSARAVTIFGPTGATHLWRWDGRQWVEI